MQSPHVSEYVAAEVRAHLARRRQGAGDLASALGVSEATAYRRLSGESAWEVDEVVAAADWFGIRPSALLPAEVGAA